jgi:hypothetical protein
MLLVMMNVKTSPPPAECCEPAAWPRPGPAALPPYRPDGQLSGKQTVHYQVNELYLSHTVHQQVKKLHYVPPLYTIISHVYYNLLITLLPSTLNVSSK